MSSTEPVDAGRKYIEAFNKGDASAMAKAFASSAFILDGMARHTWQGPGAGEQWYRDILVEGEHQGLVAVWRARWTFV